MGLTHQTLVYDGDCSFCRRAIALLERWDTGRLIVTVPFQEQEALRGLPPLDRRALEQAMHLVTSDGRVFAGAAALPVILRLLPLGRPVSWLFLVPGMPWVAARVYRLVARNRHRLGCGSATCTLGPPRG